MIIAGVDPGVQNTGIAALEYHQGKVALVTFKNIQTNKNDAFELNLRTIYDGVFQFLQKYQPQRVVFEEVFYSRNVKVALKMGHARGVAMLAAAHAHLPVSEFSPREIKLAITGNGNAAKIQVQKMIGRLLNLSTIPASFDVTDAMAAAYCYCQRKVLC